MHVTVYGLLPGQLGSIICRVPFAPHMFPVCVQFSASMQFLAVSFNEGFDFLPLPALLEIYRLPALDQPIPATAHLMARVPAVAGGVTACNSVALHPLSCMPIALATSKGAKLLDVRL